MVFINKQIGVASALGAALLIGCGLAARPAQAGYIVTLTQVADPTQPLGSDVVATGNGTIDLTGLMGPVAPGANTNPGVDPGLGQLITGPLGRPRADGYVTMGPVSGPTSFGSGGITFADTGSGAPIGIAPDVPDQLSLVVPGGYASGDPLSDTSTYDDATFTSLGVTPGTYEWAWGRPGAAVDDTFTLQVGVPEPSSLLLLGGALATLFFVCASRRSRDAE
jgi:hypothetical protein